MHQDNKLWARGEGEEELITLQFGNQMQTIGLHYRFGTCLLP